MFSIRILEIESCSWAKHNFDHKNTTNEIIPRVYREHLDHPSTCPSLARMGFYRV